MWSWSVKAGVDVLEGSYDYESTCEPEVDACTLRRDRIFSICLYSPHTPLIPLDLLLLEWATLTNTRQLFALPLRHNGHSGYLPGMVCSIQGSPEE